MTDMVRSGHTKTVFEPFSFFSRRGIFFPGLRLGGEESLDGRGLGSPGHEPADSGRGVAGRKIYAAVVSADSVGNGVVIGPERNSIAPNFLPLGPGNPDLLWPLLRALLPPWYALTAFALASVSLSPGLFLQRIKAVQCRYLLRGAYFFSGGKAIATAGAGRLAVGLRPLLALGIRLSRIRWRWLPLAALVLWWQLPQHRQAIIFSYIALGVIFLGYYWLFFRSQVDPELLVLLAVLISPMSPVARDFACWLGAGLSRFGRIFSMTGAPLWGWSLWCLFYLFINGIVNDGYFFFGDSPAAHYFFKIGAGGYYHGALFDPEGSKPFERLNFNTVGFILKIIETVCNCTERGSAFPGKVTNYFLYQRLTQEQVCHRCFQRQPVNKQNICGSSLPDNE